MLRRVFVMGMLGAASAGVASAQTQPAAPAARGAPPRNFIEPQNALERALIAATEVGAGEEERAAFRRLFLESQVALALSATDPEAPPRQVEPRPGVNTCLIFTSSARATEVMGANAARVMLTGREALERVRGANVTINMNLRPYITLDADGVAGFLALPARAPAPAAPAAPPAPVEDSENGPTQ